MATARPLADVLPSVPPLTGEQRLTVRLHRRYSLILLTVAALLVVDLIVIQPRLLRLSRYALTTNVAGRQRMLSQRLTKSALAICLDTGGLRHASHRAELSQTLHEWLDGHQALVEGNAAWELAPTQSPPILAAFDDLGRHVERMRAAAEQVLDPQVDSDSLNKAVASLLEEESQFLPKMERIVKLYEEESHSQGQWLRALRWMTAGGVVGLMVVLGRIVLRPAVETIRRQIDDLEFRVAARTAELTRAQRARETVEAERRLAEERGRELSRQLSHTARVLSLGQLATGLAHEINQPLAAIMNESEASLLLWQQATPERVDALEAMERIRATARRAGTIIKRMRDFLRPDTAPDTSVDINELVREVAALCGRELTSAAAQLDLELAPELPTALVDRIQIQQVVVNLVQNSLQALGGVPVAERQIWIRSRFVDGMVRVEVEDRGPGFKVSPETLFRPFYTTKDSGLGMGLAICRTIVGEHRGRIWAEHASPRGARICLQLPVEGVDGVAECAQHCICR